MTLPKKVTIVEVGPRDGLQNEPTIIPTNLKIDFINQLSETGLSIIEATSFVSPKWIPQMADHTKVIKNITRNPTVRYTALVPNEHGLADALAAHIQEISVFTAASETFSQKNTNCSIAESFNRISKVIEGTKKNNIPVGILFFFAPSITLLMRLKLSAMEQFVFFCEKVSDAAVKTEIS